ncbi:hypothetical protein Sste5344_001881 [Sporothrix stenoceras]
MSAPGSRTRTACGSCTRRKVRCSKTIPCETCIRRRTGLLRPRYDRSVSISVNADDDADASRLGDK